IFNNVDRRIGAKIQEAKLVPGTHNYMGVELSNDSTLQITQAAGSRPSIKSMGQGRRVGAIAGHQLGLYIMPIRDYGPGATGAENDRKVCGEVEASHMHDVELAFLQDGCQAPGHFGCRIVEHGDRRTADGPAQYFGQPVARLSADNYDPFKSAGSGSSISRLESICVTAFPARPDRFGPRHFRPIRKSQIGDIGIPRHLASEVVVPNLGAGVGGPKLFRSKIEYPRPGSRAHGAGHMALS